MEPDSPSAPRQARRMPRVPPFYPVPTRTRRDGWTVQRQADFLGMLAETGSALGACEALGGSLRKVTPPALNFFGETLVQLVLFRGRYRGSWAKSDTSALLRLVHHLDRTASEATLGHTVRP